MSILSKPLKLNQIFFFLLPNFSWFSSPLRIWPQIKNIPHRKNSHKPQIRSMKTAPSGRQLLPNLDVSHFKTGEGNGSRATGGLQKFRSSREKSVLGYWACLGLGGSLRRTFLGFFFQSKRCLHHYRRKKEKEIVYELETWRGFPSRSCFDRADPWCAEKPLYWKLDTSIWPVALHSSVVTERPQPCNYLPTLISTHTCFSLHHWQKRTFSWAKSSFNRNPHNLEFHVRVKDFLMLIL